MVSGSNGLANTSRPQRSITSSHRRLSGEAAANGSGAGWAHTQSRAHGEKTESQRASLHVRACSTCHRVPAKAARSCLYSVSAGDTSTGS